MRELPSKLDPLDSRLTDWMARYGVTLLRLSLGVVFFWFGALKLFPGLSPAEELAGRTIELVTLGMVRPALSVPLLGAWECVIGLGLIHGRALRLTLLLLFLQMPGTALPLFILPAETFVEVPFVLTLEGQYIVKNVALVSAALVVGATVRGGRLSAEPAG